MILKEEHKLGSKTHIYFEGKLRSAQFYVATYQSIPFLLVFFDDYGNDPQGCLFSVISKKYYAVVAGELLNSSEMLWVTQEEDYRDAVNENGSISNYIAFFNSVKQKALDGTLFRGNDST